MSFEVFGCFPWFSVGKIQIFIPQAFWGVVYRFSVWNKGFEFYPSSCYQVFSVAHMVHEERFWTADKERW